MRFLWKDVIRIGVLTAILHQRWQWLSSSGRLNARLLSSNAWSGGPCSDLCTSCMQQVTCSTMQVPTAANIKGKGTPMVSTAADRNNVMPGCGAHLHFTGLGPAVSLHPALWTVNHTSSITCHYLPGFMLVPIYTAWERHMSVNNLPTVIRRQNPTGDWNGDLLSASPTP